MPGIVPGRRYDQFKTLDEWRDFNVVARAAIRRAVTAAEKVKVPVAMENHKDWTTEEILPIFREFSGGYFGCCLDIGNNLALLDPSMDTVHALAPFAVTAHVKDLRLGPTPDGFEMAEVAFGTGVLDVWGAIREIRRVRPKAKLHLEVIARNPLSIPCLTERYWVTFPQRGGVDLARILRLASQSTGAFTRVDQLSKEQHLALEQNLVTASLQFLFREGQTNPTA